jgi:hypothetical protein
MRNRVTAHERDAQDRMIQVLLDEIRNTTTKAQALRGNTRTNPIRARVAEFFHANGFPNAYMTSFWIALVEDKHFDRCLHNRYQ